MKHKGYNNVISSNGNSVAQKFKYNGQEYEESLGLNLYEMDVRMYDPAIARFNGLDPVIHYSHGTSVAFDNNPIFWSDPSGANSVKWEGDYGPSSKEAEENESSENDEEENSECPPDEDCVGPGSTSKEADTDHNAIVTRRKLKNFWNAFLTLIENNPAKNAMIAQQIFGKIGPILKSVSKKEYSEAIDMIKEDIAFEIHRISYEENISLSDALQVWTLSAGTDAMLSVTGEAAAIRAVNMIKVPKFKFNIRFKPSIKEENIFIDIGRLHGQEVFVLKNAKGQFMKGTGTPTSVDSYNKYLGLDNFGRANRTTPIDFSQIGGSKWVKYGGAVGLAAAVTYGRMKKK